MEWLFWALLGTLVAEIVFVDLFSLLWFVWLIWKSANGGQDDER